MELIDYLDRVNDRESFVLFVKELIKDRQNAREIETNNPEKYVYSSVLDWENTSIENYLDGAVSWLEASRSKDISWKLMAEFLYCGKVYE